LIFGVHTLSLGFAEYLAFTVVLFVAASFIDTITRDMRLFHKLVRNNRKKGHNLIDDLYVNGETYSGNENVLQGFTEHFRQLATNNQNNESEYHRKIE
jgi:hypothetical protein